MIDVLNDCQQRRCASGSASFFAHDIKGLDLLLPELYVTRSSAVFSHDNNELRHYYEYHSYFVGGPPQRAIRRQEFGARTLKAKQAVRGCRPIERTAMKRRRRCPV